MKNVKATNSALQGFELRIGENRRVFEESGTASWSGGRDCRAHFFDGAPFPLGSKTQPRLGTVDAVELFVSEQILVLAEVVRNTDPLLHLRQRGTVW